MSEMIYGIIHTGAVRGRTLAVTERSVFCMVSALNTEQPSSLPQASVAIFLGSTRTPCVHMASQVVLACHSSLFEILQARQRQVAANLAAHDASSKNDKDRSKTE